MSKLAELIATMEGYGKEGSIPTLRNNPGDLRHSPHASHEGIGQEAIGIIDTPEHGWEDLERQLKLYAERGMTVAECIAAYAPPVENDTGNYLRFVCDGLGLPPETPMAEALEVV